MYQSCTRPQPANTRTTSYSDDDWRFMSFQRFCRKKGQAIMSIQRHKPTRLSAESFGIRNKLNLYEAQRNFAGQNDPQATRWACTSIREVEEKRSMEKDKVPPPSISKILSRATTNIQLQSVPPFKGFIPTTLRGLLLACREGTLASETT